METLCDDAEVAYLLLQKESNGVILTSPLQLIVERAQVKRACKLNKLWHSRLPKAPFNSSVMSKYKVCYQAIYKNLCYESFRALEDLQFQMMLTNILQVG